MSPTSVACPTCGGPLPRHARWITTVCPFCGSTVTNGDRAVRARDLLAAREAVEDPPDGRPRLHVEGVPWRILGRIASGTDADIFWVERAQRLGERAVLRVPHGDTAATDRAWTATTALQASEAAGAAHFTQLLPQPVARGSGTDTYGGARPVALHRFAPGYVDTVDDVRAAYPKGADGRHGVWLWRRLLELLGFVHASGWSHGGVLPEHVLVHARDHGARLVGWSRARPLAAHPDGPRADLAAAARVVRFALGAPRAGGDLPPAVPDALAVRLAAVAAEGASDAWALSTEVAAIAQAAYGPPRYHPFPLPGWRDARP